MSLRRLDDTDSERRGEDANLNIGLSCCYWTISARVKNHDCPVSQSLLSAEPNRQHWKRRNVVCRVPDQPHKAESWKKGNVELRENSLIIDKVQQAKKLWNGNDTSNWWKWYIKPTARIGSFPPSRYWNGPIACFAWTTGSMWVSILRLGSLFH